MIAKEMGKLMAEPAPMVLNDGSTLWKKPLTLRLGALALTLAFASVVEHLLIALGLADGGWIHDRGWIFKPRTETEFVSSEFRHKVITSGQGLRDHDYAIPAPPNTLRIAVVGDSLTYGWGVELDETWVKQLEAQLKAAYPGKNVEVVNLGKPAGDPNSYLPVCEMVLPRLKPDLLIIGLTQGDDLIQLALLNQIPSDQKRPNPAVRIAETLFPITTKQVKQRFRPDSHEILASLRFQAKNLLGKFDPASRKRYEALDSEVRDQFEHGLINPILVDVGCRHPEFYGKTLNRESDIMAAAARELPRTLKRFDALCRRFDTPWMVVSVPYGLYVSPEALQGRRRLGYRMPDDMLKTEVAERIVKAACDGAGVPFVSVTEAIRRLKTPGAYYPLDGHPTAIGQAQFARLLKPEISSRFEVMAKGHPRNEHQARIAR